MMPTPVLPENVGGAPLMGVSPVIAAACCSCRLAAGSQRGTDAVLCAPLGSGFASSPGARALSAGAARRADDAQRDGVPRSPRPRQAITSMTVLQSSLNTAISGSRVTFTATVENASTDAPITSGKVDFVIESPQKTVLGDIKLNKQGEASVTTTDLTQIGNYQRGGALHPQQFQHLSERGEPRHGQGDSRAAQRAHSRRRSRQWPPAPRWDKRCH